MTEFTADVVVVGGGPAGLTAAIAMATAGVETTLIAGPPRPDDPRTTALLAGSVAALDTLGVWTRCRAAAAPLRMMRIVDDTDRLLRAPEICFSAAEIGLEAFGYNIPNSALLAALSAQAGELEGLTRIADEAETVTLGDGNVMVQCRQGQVTRARLVVGADGRRSLCRAAAGILSHMRTYPQTAITLNLGHSGPHHDTSTEFHTAQGPFTLVPLPGRRSSLVWVTDPTSASEITALPDAEISAAIERRSHSILGRIAAEPGRAGFPLLVERAEQMGRHRVMLVGEAAHVIPPIGAQGLNLGLRDSATVAELVVAARREGGDVGADAVTARYDHLRRADVLGRSRAIDLLNRSLLTDLLPLHGLRGLGLFLLDRVGPLRRAVMREGIAPAAAQPRLMRGMAL
jgi:2-octaprenyl-6-methoxyphenol hydroxylase